MKVSVRLARLMLLLLVLATTATGLAVGASPARADDGRGTSARDDVPGVDAPVLPKGCFGPARSGIEPFPCPLVPFRKGRPTIVVWGDSHAYMHIPALVRAVRGAKVNLIGFVAGSCPPALVTRADAPGACRRSNYEALRYVRSLVRQKARFKVVIGSNWSGFRRAYRDLYVEGATGRPTGYSAFTKDMIRLAHEGTPRLFDRLGRLGVDVDLIGQAPTVPARRPACAAGEKPYLCDLPRWRAIPEEIRTQEYVAELRAKIRGRSRVVDTTPGYCDEAVCHGRIGTIETYFDDLHLSATRTRNLARFFKPSVRDLRRPRAR